jgi:phosphoribosylformylglycinamidine cyclo-ligase
MHADGAGTKSALAWAYWKETGDLSVWKGIAQDAVVMNTDDLLCIGCTGPMLLSSTIGRNKRLVPGEVIAALIEGTEEVLAEMRHYGLDIKSCGGETADLGDIVRTLVVDSTLFARMRRADVIDNGNIGPGLAIVGLASYGQTVYESGYNAGMGSNGLTSARHEIFNKTVLATYPDTVEPGMDASLAYTGPYGLTDAFPGTPLTAGQAVLSPTRTYAPFVIKLLQAVDRAHIKGMVHCSGGGQTKVQHFIQNLRVVKNNLLPTPPLFAEIQRVSGTSWHEMYRVFNMGHRLELYVDPAIVDTTIAIAKELGIEAQQIGYTAAYTRNQVEITSPDGGELVY